MDSTALNAVCPYYTMYPLAFPLGVLRRNARIGDWVLDPFCGRGTTNFAARLLSLPSVGIDSNPVAAALAHAKTVDSTAARVVAIARRILDAAREPADVPRGAFWRLAYHPNTLNELCRIREDLLRDCASPSRVLLRAIILGALHGPRPKGVPSYFSNQAPRTFAPKPAYAVRFWTERGLVPEEVDVLDLVARRASWYLTKRPPVTESIIMRADSRDSHTLKNAPSCRWVITSPPYYGMRTYVPDQWLRNWFLGAPAHVEYAQPSGQLEHTGADHFASDLRKVWNNAAQICENGARLVIRFGGIHDRDVPPLQVLRSSLAGTPWRIVTSRRVADVKRARRQVTQFHRVPKKSIAEHDVYARIG